VRSAGRCRGLRGGEEPAAATPGLGQTRSGVHPGGQFVAADPSPEYDGLEDSNPWSRKASIWERSGESKFRDIQHVGSLGDGNGGLKIESAHWWVRFFLLGCICIPGLTVSAHVCHLRRDHRPLRISEMPPMNIEGNDVAKGVRVLRHLFQPWRQTCTRTYNLTPTGSFPSQSQKLHPRISPICSATYTSRPIFVS
jgi:hypothetical protein